MTATHYRYECPNGHRWNLGRVGRFRIGAGCCPTCGYHADEDRGPIVDHGEAERDEEVLDR
jgi:hypothetical protein